MPYQDGFYRYFGDKLRNLSHNTTEEEIKHVYDDWASDYEKVTTVCMFSKHGVSIFYFWEAKSIMYSYLQWTPELSEVRVIDGNII